jgi:hypothetical protein
MSNHSDFDTAVKNGDYSKASSLKSDGETKNVIADVCLGAAVAGAVVTGVLYFTRPTVTEPGSATSSLRIVPSIGASSASLGLQGSF